MITKQMLIQEALSFLKSNFSPDNSFLVKKKQIKEIKRADIKIEKPSFSPKIALPIIEEKKKEVSLPIEKVSTVTIIPHPKKSTHFFAEYSKVATKLFPSFLLKETPPDDRAALAMSSPLYTEALESSVILFSFNETVESDELLQNLQKAILAYHGTASLFPVASCKTEEELSMFIQHMKAKVAIAPSTLTQKGTFFPFLKELPATSERFLHKSKLLILEPFEQYFTQPQKKKILWQTLCSLLSTPASS